MNVYWLEQIESGLPVTNNWLAPRERLRLSTLRFPKRRADWRLGRWTAKHALAACLSLPSEAESLALMEIRAAPSGEPEPFFCGAPLPVSLSLSHCAGRALCALMLSNTGLGCDLERIESRSDAFAADYFTAEEQTLVARTIGSHRALLLTLLWSAKESALKAWHEGLRLDTRSLTVALGSKAEQAHSHIWHPLQVRHTNGGVFHGSWFHDGDLVRTMVVAARSLKDSVNFERLCSPAGDPLSLIHHEGQPNRSTVSGQTALAA